jgi:chorismate synthase
MPSNRFGTYFSFTTFGESHGKGIGVVIDGCPAGLSIDIENIQHELSLRRPGKAFTSPRNEEDRFEILSGVFEGKTTGAPVAFWVENKDQKKEAYQEINQIFRPGHANYTYLHKYGHFDPFGGGRSSARETIARVIAGSIAKQILKTQEIYVLAYLHQVGDVIAEKTPPIYSQSLQEVRNQSPIFAIDKEQEMKCLIEKMASSGDSIGGIVRLITSNLPIGLGDPVYEKLEALLSYAMLSIPGSKGIEFGSGFSSVYLKGSVANDQFEKIDEAIVLKTNFSGGTLGGISNGSPLDCKIVFKPTSSIKIPQHSFDFSNQPKILDMGPLARHDPCIAVRATIVVEAMAATVLVDRYLSNKLIKL